jgi:hypothetical protein
VLRLFYKNKVVIYNKTNPKKMAKIYKIISTSNPDLVYYGSTQMSIEKRLYNHKALYEHCKKNNIPRKLTVFDILQYNDAIIELVEDLPKEYTKQQILEREGYYVMNNKCVNKNIPGQTQEQSRKEYYKRNKTEICKKMRTYYIENAEKIKERVNKYNRLKQKNSPQVVVEV